MNPARNRRIKMGKVEVKARENGPYLISGSWKKAFHHHTYVYINDAG